ncbi:dihydrolipoamide acetyltransferase family protein [Aquimarina celericrescens]|uniref:Dihydrolipoamide acetyltransferase component of pyruvate dehydrogenase complex n=1 Tax=Aquimarina celericrescens TaxID=1964542 RepID=A0ABW5ARR5_9FLAO|nr:2-oxo acid dehydrogenase subunit E2 [Aquimarina celericrescens]
MIEFKMPSLGADMEDGTLIEWRVSSGDVVKRGDIIAEVDTQKGLIEIEVFEEGTIDRLIIKEGMKVPVGTIIATIIPLEEKVPVKKEALKKSLIRSPDRIKISPLARKIAKEKEIDFSIIQGTGPEGSITKKDIELAGKKKIEPQVEILEDKRDIDIQGVRAAIASAMSRSNKEIPHFYLETRINMSKAMNWLKETNKQLPLRDRLLSVVVIIKAMAKAIKEVPEVNAYWEDSLQLKEAINIGFAVSLRKGGVVIPAILDADKKSLPELMKLLNDLIPRARALKLRSSELSESTITLTNIGEGNVDKVFGVIYPPQVAIVGFGSVTDEVWVENNTISICPVLHATLAADHRAIDGYLGGRFLNVLKKNLQQPETL